MGIVYFLVCMDCKSGVHLGKAVHTRYKSVSNPTYGFSSIGYTYEDGWRPNQEGTEELQHFLMMHRTHELRVLSERADKYAADIGFPQSWPSEGNSFDPPNDRQTFLETSAGIPDPEKEIENLPEELIRKLKTF